MSDPEQEELPTHWSPGSLLAGRFRVIAVIGYGGMGAVLEAENTALGHRVAIKVLRKELVNDREAQARFDREAKVISQLSTDYVVRVHDLGRTEAGEPFIVMERLTGKTIDDLIEAPDPVPLTHAVDLICEAAVGLSVAHAAGLVHRDIKPGNLFVAQRADGSTIVKVLDFGLTKATRSDQLRLTTSASVFGTPLYMSPEQIMSSKSVDAATDQHALALVLFELLTKIPAFYDETPTAVTVKIATHAPPRLADFVPGAPAGLDAVLQKALAKNPRERFADVAELALALAPFGTARAAEAARRAAVALNRPVVTPAVVAQSNPALAGTELTGPELAATELAEADEAGPLGVSGSGKAGAGRRGPETESPWTTRRRREQKSLSIPLVAAALVSGLALAAGGYYLTRSPTEGAAGADSARSEATAEAPYASAARTQTAAPVATASAAGAGGSVAPPEPVVEPVSSASPSAAAPPPPRPATNKPPPPVVKTAAPTAKPTGEFIPNYAPKK